jgi:hypothetical protein
MSIVPVVVTILASFIIGQFVFDSLLSLGFGIMAYLTVYLPLFFIFSMNAYEKNLVLCAFQKIFGKHS